MIVLILVGFLGGIVTGISPCILPVVPVIFASGVVAEVDAEGSDLNEEAARAARRKAQRRPFAVVGGLVLSFAVFTLIGSWLLSALGLPQDLLRDLGFVLLGILAFGLLIPKFGDLLERPFARMSAGRQLTDRGGFVLGLSLGLLFVPCAGPVLATISVVSARHHIGFSAVILTAAFALGVAIPLLAFAIAGQRLAGAMPSLRTHAATVRKVVGALLLITAVAIGANVTSGLQRALPGYTDRLQNAIEGSGAARNALDGVKGGSATASLSACVNGAAEQPSPSLEECGPAPDFTGISAWFNTPGDKALSLKKLRGRVVLVDFWTYSCINCQRSLPHVEAWNRLYGPLGLTVVGVSAPEFAFEHVLSNVEAGAAQLGVHYPVALDNNLDTWTAYDNSYWPAEYLIDATGHIRHVAFGEGDYGLDESLIRQLLTAAHPGITLPAVSDLPDTEPTQPTTPESYLGTDRLNNVAGQTVTPGALASYALPSTVPPNELAFGGQWNIGAQSALADNQAVLQLNYEADDVYLVLGGTGTVDVSVNGKPTKTVAVSGTPRLYTLVSGSSYSSGLLSLSVSPGVQAYDFTFG